jgi:mRNA-degrading endonuclease YafQ of YafQ-DinJ toxin-antitoxin module
MYKIQFGHNFRKNFKKFDSIKQTLILKKVNFLKNDPDHPSLRTEPLYKGLRSSSVNMDIRIIWEIVGDIINLINVGKHDIYRQYKNKRKRKSAFRENQ